MKYSVLIIIAVALIGVGLYMLFVKKKKLDGDFVDGYRKTTSKKELISLGKDSDGNELAVQLEMLPAESFDDNSSLIEIKDSAVLARIDSLIPGLAQSGVGAANAVRAGGETVYKAIIPAGTKLANSNSMDGAVRGFYRGADGIQGHANLVAVNQTASKVANTAAAAMGVASVVVGQYYMTQINTELNEISEGIERIALFQDDEYKSRVFALVSQVKKIASFKIEILDNDELRSAEIAHLNELEDECIKLLGQANLKIASFAKENDFDFKGYEKRLQSAQNWYIYQQTLLDVLYKIADLKYTLHFGNVSREQCEALLPTYLKQVSDAQEMLSGWHEATVKRLKVDISETKRKRSGVDAAIHWIPGLFDEKHNYRTISERTADMIGVQLNSTASISAEERKELYSEDVQIVSKDGKLFYLPPVDKVRA